MLEMRKILNLFMAVNERDNAMTFFCQTKKIVLRLQRQPPARVLSLLVLLSAGSAVCMTKLSYSCGINFRYQKCAGVH